MLYTPGLEQLDPALLAFVKCHVTSPLKWEALRVLADRNGAWVRAEQLARATHKEPRELAVAMAELAAEGVVEVARSGEPEEVLFRLPPQEPTTVVARRLIEAATHSQELRAVIAAYLARSRAALQPPASATAAA
jgi:hypothetical protein